MNKYFYKEGKYTQERGSGGWNYNSWTQTGRDIEVTKEFYFNFLLPDEEKILHQLQSLGIKRTFHHQPFIKHER